MSWYLQASERAAWASTGGPNAEAPWQRRRRAPRVGRVPSEQRRPPRRTTYNARRKNVRAQCSAVHRTAAQRSAAQRGAVRQECVRDLQCSVGRFDAIDSSSATRSSYVVNTRNGGRTHVSPAAAAEPVPSAFAEDGCGCCRARGTATATGVSIARLTSAATAGGSASYLRSCGADVGRVAAQMWAAARRTRRAAGRRACGTRQPGTR